VVPARWGSGRLIAAALWALVLVLVGGCAGTSATPDGASVHARVSSPPSTPADAHKVTAATETYLFNIYSPAIANIRAVLVTVGRRPLVQLYRASTPTQTHDVHSVTKSVVGTLIGIALSENKLHSLDDTLATLLPEHRKEMGTAVAGITLRQLLTMTAGLPADPANGDPPDALSGPDWVAKTLRNGTVARPGSAFAYSSAGSHLLAAVLTHAVGMSVLDYARPRLFEPLGVNTRNAFEPRTLDEEASAQYDKADFAWPKDPTGIQFGFGALKMAPRDLAKLGQLYLDGGRWDGRQIVPANWVNEATSTQVRTQGPGFTFSEGYGYQWWVTKERGHHAYAAIGFGGQMVEVVPDMRLVLVTAAETGDNNLRWEQLRGMVADAVLPAAGG
jgi:CubicO group peptidase (beta-lactamase class C family)